MMKGKNVFQHLTLRLCLCEPISHRPEHIVQQFGVCLPPAHVVARVQRVHQVQPFNFLPILYHALIAEMPTVVLDHLEK